MRRKAPALSPLVLVIGSSNTDLVIRCPRLPRPGETLLGGDFSRSAGGKGANQAVAAARAGCQVAFVGAHGDDDFGKAAKSGLRSEGINVRHFRVCPGASSGLALILLGGRSRQNMIAVARSANDQLTAGGVEAAADLFPKAGAVVCQLETPLEAALAAARLAARHGVPFLLNPAPVRKLPKRLYRLVDTLTPNEQEAEILTGLRAPAAAAEALRAAGCRNVVITLGERGVLVCGEDGGMERIPALRVRPVDTVGAGDCFTGWLAAGIAEGLTLSAAARRAVKAAALAVTRPGAQAGMPWRKEVVEG